MGKSHRQSANGDPHDGYVIVSSDVLNRIVTPLTVVHGHVQLLRRRAQHDQVIESDDLNRALTQMEEATRKMVSELSGIMRETSRASEDSDAG